MNDSFLGQTRPHGHFLSTTDKQHADRTTWLQPKPALIWRGVLAMRDTDLISKTPPLLLGRLDIRSLGEGIAFIARLRGGAPHSALSHTHRDLREERVGRKKKEKHSKRSKSHIIQTRKTKEQSPGEVEKERNIINMSRAQRKEQKKICFYPNIKLILGELAEIKDKI